MGGWGEERRPTFQGVQDPVEDLHPAREFVDALGGLEEVEPGCGGWMDGCGWVWLWVWVGLSE